MAVSLTSEVGQNGAGEDSLQSSLRRGSLGTLSLYAQEISDQLCHHLVDAGLIKDRRHRLRTVGKCFVGSEVVDFLVEHAHTTRSEAIDMLNYLTFKEFIQRTTPVTDGQPEFEDGHGFYRFKVDNSCPVDTGSKRSTNKSVPDIGLLHQELIKNRRCYSMSADNAQRSPLAAPRKRSVVIQRERRPVTTKLGSSSTSDEPPTRSTASISDSVSFAADRTAAAYSAMSAPTGHHLKDDGYSVGFDVISRDDEPGFDDSTAFFADSDEIGVSFVPKADSYSSVRSHISISSMVSSVKDDTVTQKDAAEFVDFVRNQWKEAQLIKDHRHHLATYANSFVASHAVTWLVECEEHMERQDAVDLMQLIEQLDFIHHVTDSHHFQDANYFFRFREDDGTMLPAVSMESMILGEDIYWQAKNSTPPVICDRSYRGKAYPMCIIAKDFVDKLLEWKYFVCRKEAVKFCRQLVSAGMLHHVCYEHQFKDAFLYFRFTFDNKTERSPSTSSSGRRLRNTSKAVARLRRPVETFAARRKSFRTRDDSAHNSPNPSFRRSGIDSTSRRGTPKAASPSPSIRSNSTPCTILSDNLSLKGSDTRATRHLSFEYGAAKRRSLEKKHLIGRSLSDTGLLCRAEVGVFFRPRTLSLCSETDTGGIFV